MTLNNRQLPPSVLEVCEALRYGFWIKPELNVNATLRDLVKEVQ